MKPVIPQGHRNLRALMRRRLPAKIFKRLQEIGRLADATSMSAYLVGGLVRTSCWGVKTWTWTLPWKATAWPSRGAWPTATEPA